MKPELLLPVGNMDMCLAAIHHGADAVYVGVPFFNARGRSADLGIVELKEIIDLCHLYGVKVNLAFNVVIFEQEFPKVYELLQEILPLGPDAFIVQDLGLAALIRQVAPEQRIHASTQMTITNPDAIALLEDLGIQRFVLGRENSLAEIQLIREQTDKELEVFVHGALCVAYSGQCFTSESLGGRSANRGQCAQSCRLDYELFVDGAKKNLGDKKYLVSPQDLMGLSEVGELKRLGVNSFKVEGRLKSPEYVAATARNYREVLDGAPLDLSRRLPMLAATYSRGFFSGWLKGVDHQRLVDGTYSAHRGLFVGEVLSVKKHMLTISSNSELRVGMGLLFASGEEHGSKIFAVRKSGQNYEVELLRKDLTISAGARVYVNSDEVLKRDLQRAWTSREHKRRVPIRIRLEGELGSPLVLEASDPEGRTIQLSSEGPLTCAQSRPLTLDQIREELGALSASVYELSDLAGELPENVFLHQKEFKILRRRLVEALNERRLTGPAENLKAWAPPLKRTKLPASSTRLNVLLRNRDQVQALCRLSSTGRFRPFAGFIGDVILDFEFGKDYGDSVSDLRTEGFTVVIATTRILKPKEYHHLKLIVRCAPDKILVRNLGALEFLRRETKIPLLGDFSLNVTNSSSLSYLISKGLSSVNLSYDLNQAQLLDLLEYADPTNVEITIHQYMPEFHMEHCVFAAFLSNGSSFRDCGKPCEKHEVKLRDPYGNWHFLKADQECRNTFFKATPQSASFLLEELEHRGVERFRLELLDEGDSELERKILTYLRLLSKSIDPTQAMEELSILESYGLGAGQLQKRDVYRDRKKSLRT